MITYQAVLLDECGHEFGASVAAPTKADAYDELRDMYPENRGIVQVESPQDTHNRQTAMYARLDREQNGEFYEEEDFSWG